MAALIEALKKTAQDAVQAAICALPKQPPKAAAKCEPKPGAAKPGVKTGLGSKVDKIVGKSPVFVKKLKDLQTKGYKFRYGKAGDGTFIDKTAKVITIDGNDKSNPTEVVTGLAHEVGHAGYKNKYTPPAGLTRQQFVQANLRDNLDDEGEATLTNIELKRDLKKNCGPDITIAGTQAKQYEKIFDKYPNAKDRSTARREIGDIFADHEHTSTPPHPTYRKYYSDFYGDYYDKNVAGKK